MKVLSPIMERALDLYRDEIAHFLREGKDRNGNPYLELDIDGNLYRLEAPPSPGEEMTPKPPKEEPNGAKEERMNACPDCIVRCRHWKEMESKLAQAESEIAANTYIQGMVEKAEKERDSVREKLKRLVYALRGSWPSEGSELFEALKSAQGVPHGRD